jgi:hypothetical protein
VSGVVRWDDGQPAVGVTVQGYQLPTTRQSTKTGAAGEFTLTGLAKGTLNVWASRKELDFLSASVQQGPSSTVVTLGANERKTGVELVLDRGGRKISGVVRGPDGKPLSGAGVGAVLQTSSNPRPRIAFLGMGDTAKAYSAADGSFTVDDLSKGSYTVWASHAGLPEVEQSGVAADATGIVLQFKAAAVLAGVVTDADKKPITDYTVSAVGKLTSQEQQTVRAALGGGNQQTVHDASGAFELGGLAPDTYDVLVTGTDGRVGKLSGIVVGEAEQKRGLSIVVGQGTTLKGRAVELGSEAVVAGAQVLVMAGAKPIKTTTDAEGAFQVDGLQPGIATLSIIGDFSTFVPDARELTVPSTDVKDAGAVKLLRGSFMTRMGSKVGLRVRNRDGLVTVDRIDADSPAQKAGIQVGEVVLAVDGQVVNELGSSAVAYLLGGAIGTSVVVRLAKRDVTLTRVPR